MEESWGGLFDDQYMDPNPVAARPGACEPTERVTRQRVTAQAEVISSAITRHSAFYRPPDLPYMAGRLPFRARTPSDGIHVLARVMRAGLGMAMSGHPERHDDTVCVTCV